MNRASVLIADDDEDFLAIAERALRRAGVEADVRIARDGGEALRMLGLDGDGGRMASNPDVVLLDLNMPVATGWEVLDRMRADHSTHAIPVVVLSSSRDPADIRRSYESGANSYVSKRYDDSSPGAYVASAVRYWTELNEAPHGPGRGMR
jgi:two-component system response regulator